MASSTVCATIVCPVAFGWIPSERFSSGIPATPERINGIRSESVSCARLGYREENADLYDSPRLVGICIHQITVLILRDCSVCIISLMFCLSKSVESHCNPSFPPITIKAMSPLCASAVTRSILVLSHALVSPDSHPLITLILYHNS